MVEEYRDSSEGQNHGSSPTTLYQSELARLLSDGYILQEAAEIAKDYVRFLSSGVSGVDDHSVVLSYRERDQDDTDLKIQKITKTTREKVISFFNDKQYTARPGGKLKTYQLDSVIKLVQGYRGISRKAMVKDIRSYAYNIKKHHESGTFKKGGVQEANHNTKYKNRATGTKAHCFKNLIQAKNGRYRKDKEKYNGYKYLMYYVADHYKEILELYDNEPARF